MVLKLSGFALATALAMRVSPAKFQGWGGSKRRRLSIDGTRATAAGLVTAGC